MSLATLKKKTNAKYNNLSVGQGFSLNGVHRNQGYIGQTSLSRTIIGTPMKGNAPKGHGGCCGTYFNKIVKPALCLEKSEMVKRSVLSSNGMLRLRNKWLNGKSTVKPDVNQNNNIASMATVMKRRKAINELKQNDVITIQGITGKSSLSGKGEEFINGGEMYLTSSDLELGSDGKRDKQIVGTCFDNVNIPKNSVINSANIKFIVDEIKSGTTYLKLKVYGDNSINPALPSSTSGDFSSRPQTNSISWEPDNIGSVGSSYYSCDISSILQELVNNAGWNTNGRVCIFFEWQEGEGVRCVESNFAELNWNYNNPKIYDCNPLIDPNTKLLSYVEQIGSMEQNKYILKKTSECILNDPVQLQSSIDKRPLPSQTPKI